MQTIKAILKAARAILSAADIDEKEQTYRDFCTCLLEIINQPKSYLITNKKKFVTSIEYQKISEVLKRLSQNEPIELIQKKAIFKGHIFKVNQHTLIPRVDSEILLDETINRINDLIGQGKQNLKIADLGTGSGILAICLALELDRLKRQNKVNNYKIVASDISSHTLKVAKFNEQKMLGGGKITWLKSDWFNQFNHQFEPHSFDLIVSNPPYIVKSDNSVQDSIRFEPKQALFSKKNGLADIEKIIQGSINWLKPNGFLLLEHGFNQGDEITNLLKNKKYQNIASINDNQNLPRVILAKQS